MNGSARTVNATILVLLVTVTATGVLAFAVGTPGPASWVVGVHGASGLGLLLLVPAKSRIARRGLRRPGRSRKVMGLALAVLAVLAVVSGLLHALRGWAPVVLGLLPMQVHVGAAVGTVVLAGMHVLVHHQGRRRRPLVRRTDLDRRRALLGTGVVAGSALLWLGVPGRERRQTGSHEVVDAAAVPVTQWMFDPVPRLPARPLRVPGGEVDLAALPTATVRAVLDCTGGWYTGQEWRGVRVADLGLPAGASVDVVSATGYRAASPRARPARCCWPRTWPGGRSRPGTGRPCGSSHRGGAGSGG